MTDLRIPLAKLPGPCPAGAPVVYSRAFGSTSISGTVVAASGGGVWISRAPTGSTFAVPVHRSLAHAALDLTPPPIVDGFPTRIDGADVAAGMLARLARVADAGQGVHWQVDEDDCGVCLTIECAGGLLYLDRRDVPALADLDSDDPLAPRHALAAALRSGWRPDPHPIRTLVEDELMLAARSNDVPVRWVVSPDAWHALLDESVAHDHEIAGLPVTVDRDASGLELLTQRDLHQRESATKEK